MTEPKSNYIDKLEGFVFSITHYLIVMISFILGMFTKDWFTLLIITFNMLVILGLNIYLQDCPLSVIENDKLGTGITNMFMNLYFKKEKINKNTKYVIQTGSIIFMLSIVCIKGLILLFRRNIRDFLIYLDD
jgi:hypothetical protein|tara:strand:+ start:705 stop:1100 length:396 start_codon:yes stop_codon:yes gene_type:complete